MASPPEFQVTSGGAIALQPVAVARKSPSRLFWDRFKQDKAALAGGIVIIILVLVAIVGGPLAESITGHPQNTTYTQMTDAFGVPKGPNSQFWFGADAAAATSSFARCTGHAPRSSSASSRPASPS